jgi:TonB family protein
MDQAFEQTARQGFNVRDYLARQLRAVKAQWSHPNGSAVVKVKIGRKGSISEIAIVNQREAKVCEEAALHAVVEAAPYFEPIPEQGPDYVESLLIFTSGDVVFDPTCMWPLATTYDEAAQPDLCPYLANATNVVKRNWHPPLEFPALTVKVHCTINDKGVITNSYVSQSSYCTDIDEAAVEAVANSRTKLGTLPDGSPDHIEVEFEFRSSVFGRKVPG